MSFWNWDTFESTWKELNLEFETTEPLPHKISKYSFERNSYYRLLLTTESPYTLKVRKQIPLGTVTQNLTESKISSHLGSGYIKGIEKISQVSNLKHALQGCAEDTFEITEFNFKFNNKNTVNYTVDHISNFNHKGRIWPSFYEDNDTKTRVRSFLGDSDLIFKTQARSERNSRCLRIKVSGIDVILGDCASKSSDVENTGYILYSGEPGEEIRARIRSALSFALGSPLVYFSSATYSEEGYLISLSAFSPHTVSNRAWEIAPAPPAPLFDIQRGYSNLVSESAVQRIVQSIFDGNPDYGFEHIIWRLWYADSAPYFMRPAYYGALLEGLQQRYIKTNAQKVSRLLIDKKEFAKIKATLERLLQKQNYEAAENKIFQGKIESGNVVPQKIVSQRFFETLGLEISPLELDAWDRRNDAAHGNEIKPDNIINFIRQTKILKTLLMRVILRISDSSDHFIDYYSLGLPLRPLSQGIPAQDNSQQ